MIKKRVWILTSSMVVLIGLSLFLILNNSRVPIVSSIFTDVSELKNTHKENKLLKSLLEEHQQNVATKNLLKMENKELRKVIETTNILKDRGLNVMQGTAIARDLTTENNSLLISNGSNQGVKHNMAVITAEGLIGKVVDVEEDYSVVQLLSGDDSKKNYVSITLKENKEALGILTGYDRKNKEFLFTSIDEKLDMGSTIVTSGLGGIYPAGIEIGEITNRTYIQNGLEYLYNVEPAVDFDSITDVIIVFN